MLRNLEDERMRMVRPREGGSSPRGGGTAAAGGLSSGQRCDARGTVPEVVLRAQRLQAPSLTHGTAGAEGGCCQGALG